MYRTKIGIFDIALIIAILALAIAMLFLPLIFGRGEKVIIETADYNMEYSLRENVEMDIESNSHRLHVVIKDGRVSVTESDCRDGVCVNSGAISSRGQTIVCAPAGIVIRIDGEGDADHVAG